MENRTNRLDAWTGLGQTMTEGTTPEEALALAGLAGWNVRRVPLTAQAAPGVSVEVPGQFAVVRDTDGEPEVVSVVGASYQVIQNEDLLPLVHALIEETGAQVVTAGRLPRGPRDSVYLTLRLPRPIRIGTDTADIYLTVSNTHDGHSAGALLVTPVHTRTRAVLNLDLPGAPHKLRVAHRTGATAALRQQAEQEAIDHVYAYTDAFEAAAGELAAQGMDQVAFERLLARAFDAPRGSSNAKQTRAERKMFRMARMFSGVHGATGWDALVTIAEWHDFYSEVRTNGVGSEQAARHRKALLEPGTKETALELLLAV